MDLFDTKTISKATPKEVREEEEVLRLRRDDEFRLRKMEEIDKLTKEKQALSKEVDKKWRLIHKCHDKDEGIEKLRREENALYAKVIEKYKQIHRCFEEMKQLNA